MSHAPLRPFFSFYGSKYRAVGLGLYPPPDPRLPIVEPFAGSAGFSVHHPDHAVWLNDVDPAVVATWRYLVRVRPGEILALPDLAPDQTTDDLCVCAEARLLIGWWIRRGVAKPATTPTRWMRSGRWPSAFWGASVRRRLAQQVQRIRHWRVTEGSYENLPDVEATWFIDPPYSGHAGSQYARTLPQGAYDALGAWCRARRGLVVVCEAPVARWLPFRSLGHVRTLHKRRRSKEAVWTNRPITPSALPLFEAHVTPDVAPPPVVVPKPETFSASEVTTFRHCPRQHVWERVYNYKRPPSPEREEGDAIHAQLEAFTKRGAEPEHPRAKEAVRHLRDMPRSLLRAEGRFLLPIAPFRLFTGFFDLMVADPGHPRIVDYKTMKDLKWAKVEHELREDTQLLCYAKAAVSLIPAPDAETFTLQQVQIQTKKTVRSLAPETVVPRQHVEERWSGVLDTVQSMAAARRLPITEVPLPEGGYGGPACFRYGPCVHLERCALVLAKVPVPHNPAVPDKEPRMPPIDPPDSTRRKDDAPPATPNTVHPSNLPKELRAKQEEKREKQQQELRLAAQLEESAMPTADPKNNTAAAFAAGSAGTKTERPPLSPADAFLASVGAGSGARPSAPAPAPAAQQAPTPSSTTDALAALKAKLKGASTPAPEPGDKDLEALGSDPLVNENADKDEEKRGPGRPKGSKNKPKDDAAPSADGTLHLAAVVAQIQAQAEAERDALKFERDAALKTKVGAEDALKTATALANTTREERDALAAKTREWEHAAKSFEAQARALEGQVNEAVRIAESLQQENAALKSALHASGKQQAAPLAVSVLGPTLYLDCMPMGSSTPPVVHLAHLLEQVQEDVRGATGLHWQLHDYGKGAAFLAERVRTMVLPAGGIVVESGTPLARAVIEVLMVRCTGGIVRRI